MVKILHRTLLIYKMLKFIQLKSFRYLLSFSSLTDETLKKSTKVSSAEERKLQNEITHYAMRKHDLSSIGACIAKSSRLQKEVEERLINTKPTLIKTADIVMCVLMLLSYRLCARDFLETR